MLETADLLLLNGYVITMDSDDSVFKDGGVAVTGDRITAVGPSDWLRLEIQSDRVIDASRKVIMPGLIDTYGHAGHGLIRAIWHATHGWPPGEIYFRATTPDWWYAEARLAAVERLRFGVTTGQSVIGATPARLDDPIFAIKNAEAYSEVGIRASLAVGPPDLFFSHLPDPWSGTFLEDGQWVERDFTYEQAMENAIAFVEEWHNGSDDRIRAAFHPPYLMGRFTKRHSALMYDYQPEDIPVMIEKAEEVRNLADLYSVQIHTHLFDGSVDFALEHFGRGTVEWLLGPDVLVLHGNGLRPTEVEIVGGTKCNIASSPSTAENVQDGILPMIDLLDEGANIAIATDGSAPRFSFDLLKEIPRALMHQWMAHRSQQVLPPGKALRMVTIDAAKALNWDAEIGSLEPGKKADIITIDLNQPHLTPQAHIPQLLTFYASGQDVDTAIVDGRILMENRQILSVDANAVMTQARDEAGKVFDRVDLDRYLTMDRDFWRGSRY